MVSHQSFFFSHSPIVAPIVCSVCGKNAHCLRRQAQGSGECQTFQCECGNTEARFRDSEPSDAAIQGEIENRIKRGNI